MQLCDRTLESAIKCSYFQYDSYYTTMRIVAFTLKKFQSVDVKPEEKARQKIDQLLHEAGWAVQDVQELNLGAAHPGPQKFDRAYACFSIH